MEYTDFHLPPGHPISLLQLENAGLEQVLDIISRECAEDCVPDAGTVVKALIDFNGVRAHYAKTEELTRAVREDAENVFIYKGRIAAVAQKAREMMIKEEKILYPQSLRFFTEEEWLRIYRDFPEMGMAFVDNPPKWEVGESWAQQESAKVKEQEILNGIIKLPTGELTVQQLSAIFSLLPLDLTFIDAEGKLRFFINEGRVFLRPLAALGRDVRECHPPRIVPVVENLLAEFKAKKRDSLEVARYIMGRPVLVKYMAVYDEQGEYMGTLEAVQDCGHILEKFTRR